MKDVDSGSAVGDTTLDGIRDSILITDRIGHGYLKEHLVDYLAYVVILDCGQELASVTGGREALQMAKAGAPIFVWCSDTAAGWRVASATPRCLPTDMSALYINECTPEEWHGSPPLKELTNRASEQPPRRPSRKDVDRYRVSAQNCAELLLKRYPDRLLVVQDEQDALSDLYVLDAYGVWYRGDNTLLRWMGEVADELRRRAIEIDKLDGREHSAMLARIRRLEEPDTLPKIRKEAVAALANLLQRGDLNPEDVTTCLDTDLDSNMQNLGCLNGVIDLTSGKLLKRDKAREALVTLRAPTEFDPKATHRVVDDLFGRMSEDRRRHYLGALGNGLRAIPKRLYAVVCEPDCGKTTHLKLIVNTLGDHYAKVAAPHVIQQRKRSRSSETQLTPGLTAWWLPTRIVVFDEVKETELSPEIVKDLTGGGLLTARRLTKNLKTLPATATTFMFSNEETVPKIGSSADKGLRVRYRELKFPYIPDDERDDGEIRDTMTRDPEVRKAFLTLLVRAAAENPTPPDDTPEVRQLTVARTIAEGGELARFSRRVVPAPGSFIAFKDLWKEWSELNDAPDSDKAPGGISKRIIGRRLEAFVEGLPSSILHSRKGDKVRGWLDWRLLTVEEAETLEMIRPARARADRAIDDLFSAFHSLAPEEREQLIMKITNPERMMAIIEVYGQDLEEAIENTCPPLFLPDGEQSSPLGILLSKGYTDQQAVALLDVQRILSLSLCAGLALDTKRRRSPAYQKVEERFDALADGTDHEEIALFYLMRADRKLGAEATPDDLKNEAVRLVVADANGEQIVRPQRPVDVEDMEAAIKELCEAG